MVKPLPGLRLITITMPDGYKAFRAIGEDGRVTVHRFDTEDERRKIYDELTLNRTPIRPKPKNINIRPVAIVRPPVIPLPQLAPINTSPQPAPVNFDLNGDFFNSELDQAPINFDLNGDPFNLLPQQAPVNSEPDQDSFNFELDQPPVSSEPVQDSFSFDLDQAPFNFELDQAPVSSEPVQDSFIFVADQDPIFETESNSESGLSFGSYSDTFNLQNDNTFQRW